MRIIFCLLLLLWSCKSTNLSTMQAPATPADEEGIIGFAHNTDGQFATTILKRNHYKYEVTHQVFDDLIRAKGDRRMPEPTLKISNGRRNVAYAKPGEALIGLETKAYDICISFGADSLNALAALLAHELTHYYEKHRWEEDFFLANGDTPWDEAGDAQTDKIKLETQADYLGGFLAYTAGYNTLDIMPTFLEKVYKEYGFPAKMKNYPTLAERQQMAVTALEDLQQLVHVYEAGNWLVALEEYESAKKYYDYILLEGQFQSREIYNNLGVMAALAAIQYFEENEIKYTYPLELDPESRMSKKKKGMLGYAEKVKIRNALLENAEKYFSTAFELDPEYPAALLNKGCVYALLENYDDASYYARKARTLAQKKGFKKTKADAEALLGITAALQGDEDTARKQFAKAKKEGSHVGQLNEDLMNDKHPKGQLDPNMASLEKIDNVHLDKVVNQLYMGSLNWENETTITRQISFGIQSHPQSKILIHYQPFDEAFAFIHVTNPGYNGQTNKSIALGTSTEALAEAYGLPQRTMQLTIGQYLIYEKQRMIFYTRSGKVQGWALFRVKKPDE